MLNLTSFFINTSFLPPQFYLSLQPIMMNPMIFRTIRDKDNFWALYQSTVGPVSVHCGPCIGPLWAMHGSTVGSAWVHCGLCMGPLWALYRSTVGPVSVHCWPCIGPLWALYRSTVGSVWVHCGLCIGPLWALYRSTVQAASLSIRPPLQPPICCFRLQNVWFEQQNGLNFEWSYLQTITLPCFLLLSSSTRYVF